MAAGQGFKTFTTGEVLTAGDVNGYLMQGINVFASTAARDAAITSPQEGQFAFTKDTNGLWYYDGAAWVASGATGDIEGVTAGVGISGGGTSGTVTITNSMATAIDAKGDLVAGTGADAFSRLAVGANGTVLTADSAAATGLNWTTPATGGYTQLASGSLSGASVSLTSISGSYKDLRLIIRNYKPATDAANMRARFNNVTTTHYAAYANDQQNGFTADSAATELTNSAQDDTTATGIYVCDFLDYANATTFKIVTCRGITNHNSLADAISWQNRTTFFFKTEAISRIDFFPSSGNFTSGTYQLLGLN
jgi:hypothetical protein